MDLNEAIKYAFTGNALIFLGSGFSKGAVSLKGIKLPIGSELCNMIKERLKIKDEEDDDIQYYSSKFRN